MKIDVTFKDLSFVVEGFDLDVIVKKFLSIVRAYTRHGTLANPDGKWFEFPDKSIITFSEASPEFEIGDTIKFKGRTYTILDLSTISNRPCARVDSSRWIELASCSR